MTQQLPQKQAHMFSANIEGTSSLSARLQRSPLPIMESSPLVDDSSPDSAIEASITSPSVSVDELICTVGASAVFEQMVPPDGLCHYIYYTHVAVVKGSLHAVEVSQSWHAFQNALVTYKTTSGGIAFDVRYVNVGDLDASLEDKSLKNLTSRNVKHYGVLNVLDTASKVKGVFAKAKGLLKAHMYPVFAPKNLSDFLPVSFGTAEYPVQSGHNRRTLTFLQAVPKNPGLDRSQQE
ncbi:hypothetical protein HPB52_004942 [Rhipicephalus sanguineus]|uniref:Uncharacterized protein n=1 Tax=Rhipicephalus sanguineus TaxID=34632 RepID=A0A9D4PBJ7_RHISA|nr:hypothetical protein HPB52_004942 [Rhipicephalus sanguineus]